MLPFSTWLAILQGGPAAFLPPEALLSLGGQSRGQQEWHFLCSLFLGILCSISQAPAHHFLECLDRVMQ